MFSWYMLKENNETKCEWLYNYNNCIWITGCKQTAQHLLVDEKDSPILCPFCKKQIIDIGSISIS